MELAESSFSHQAPATTAGNVTKSLKYEGHFKTPRVSKQRQTEIVTLYRAGQSALWIAKSFNMSSSTIYRILHNRGIPVHYPKISIAADIKRAKAMAKLMSNLESAESRLKADIDNAIYETAKPKPKPKRKPKSWWQKILAKMFG